MLRYCLLIPCLLTSWFFLLAQDPTTETEEKEPAATSAVEKAPDKPPRPLTTYTPVLPLTVYFNDPGTKSIQTCGMYLDRDGLVLSVLPSAKPIKYISAHFDRPELLPNVRPEVTVLARDELTGLCLLKTPYRCLRPHSLTDTTELKPGTKLDFTVKYSGLRYRYPPGSTVNVSLVDVKTTLPEFSEIPHLCELFVTRSDELDNAYAETALERNPAFWIEHVPFDTWAAPGMVYIGEHRSVAAVVLAIRQPEQTNRSPVVSGTCFAIPGRDARVICDRLLSEVKLPPLPPPRPSVVPVPDELLAAESARLAIDYDNGDQDTAIGVFVSEEELVVPTEAVTRSRLITSKQFELDRPFTLVGDDPANGLSLLKRGQWPATPNPVYLNLEATEFQIGQELVTIPSKDKNAASSQRVKVAGLDLTVQGQANPRSHLIQINQNLERGTPLYDAADRFVALVVSDRQSPAGVGYAIPADEMWLGLARFRQTWMGQILEPDERLLRQAGKPVRRVFKLNPSELTLVSQRLKPLFSELRFAIDAKAGSLIVELDPQQSEAALGWMEQIRKQLSFTAMLAHNKTLVSFQPTKTADDPSEPAPGPNPQAIEQAKWITNRQVLDLELVQEESDETIKQSGFFISRDGLLLTVITKKQPLKRVSATFIARDPIECKLLVRDPATGLALISTPLKCQHPFNLVDKLAVPARSAFLSPGSWYSPQFDSSAFMFTNVDRVSNGAVDDVVLKSPLAGNYQTLAAGTPFGGRPIPGNLATMKGQPIMSGHLVAAMICSSIRTGSDGQVEDKQLAIAGDEARTICQRLLQESNLPLLPDPDGVKEAASEVSDSATAESQSVPLEVEYNNGDRETLNAAVLDADGFLATAGWDLTGLQRVRSRQLGLRLDVERRSLFQGDWIALVKLVASGKQSILDLSLESPVLHVGDSLFDRIDTSRPKTPPCGKIAELDATLEIFDGSQSGLLKCDQTLPAGTPLFNAAGQFIGLCLPTPKVFANTTFILPEDRFWRLVAAPLNRSGFVDQIRQSDTRSHQRQYVQTYRFDLSESTIVQQSGQGSSSTISLKPISPELLGKTFHRLQTAFPELQIAIGKEEQSLIVVLEPQQDDSLLVSVDYWIDRLVQSGTKTKNANKDDGKRDEPSDKLKLAYSKVKKEDTRKQAAIGLFPEVPGAPSATRPLLSGNADADVRDIVRRFQGSPADKREAVRNELLQLTTRQFEQRHQQRLNELKTLEDRLTALRTELQKREELRSEIIRKRVADLLSDENLLKWETEDEGAMKSSKAVRP